MSYKYQVKAYYQCRQGRTEQPSVQMRRFVWDAELGRYKTDNSFRKELIPLDRGDRIAEYMRDATHTKGTSVPSMTGTSRVRSKRSTARQFSIRPSSTT
jgi:hypothetical protein